MHRLLSLLPIGVLLLVGCRSGGPTVNPFMGSTTVPAQPTGAIGPGANNAPYYPPNVVPGQPSSVPPAGPYGVPAANQPQWMPQGTGAVNNSPGNAQFAATPNAFRASGDVVDIDAQMRAATSAIYDARVTPASVAVPVNNTNTLSISKPVSYANSSESAVRVPTDSSPLVTHRQQLPPVVQSAPITAQIQPQQMPVVYDTRQAYVQTVLPPQQSAMNSSAGQPIYTTPQSMPASMVYGGVQPQPMTVTQQEIQPYRQTQQIQLQPIPQYQPTSVAMNTSGVPTLAYGPTLASAQTPVTRMMPAVEITDLPPARSAFP